MELTTMQLAEKLGVVRATIHLWRRDHGMPYRQYGGKTFRYDLDEVKEWADKKFKNNKYGGL